MDYEKLISAIILCGSPIGVEKCKKCVYWNGGDLSKCIPNMTSEAATAIKTLLERIESAESRAEKAERERDAAIKMLRKIEWCNGCKNFRGLQGCRIGALVTCNPQNDMYVFGEGEE